MPVSSANSVVTQVCRNSPSVPLPSPSAGGVPIILQRLPPCWELPTQCTQGKEWFCRPCRHCPAPSHFDGIHQIFFSTRHFYLLLFFHEHGRYALFSFLKVTCRKDYFRQIPCLGVSFSVIKSHGQEHLGKKGLF